MDAEIEHRSRNSADVTVVHGIDEHDAKVLAELRMRNILPFSHEFGRRARMMSDALVHPTLRVSGDVPGNPVSHALVHQIPIFIDQVGEL